MNCDYTSIYDKMGNIYELQTMLRRISRNLGFIRLINPDGIYGSETKEAVEKLQEYKNIPITGKVDYLTWSAITDLYNRL